jgi:hypothetical protein
MLCLEKAHGLGQIPAARGEEGPQHERIPLPPVVHHACLCRLGRGGVTGQRPGIGEEPGGLHQGLGRQRALQTVDRLMS